MTAAVAQNMSEILASAEPSSSAGVAACPLRRWPWLGVNSYSNLEADQTIKSHGIH